jgi:hypothetical protein
MRRRRCEILLLVLVHNVNRLIHFYFEEGVVPDFNAAARFMAQSEKVFTCDKKVPESYLENLKLSRRKYDELVYDEPSREWLLFDDGFVAHGLEDE